jgi:glycosyltransferase involved in cell wall biosynthesis
VRVLVLSNLYPPHAVGGYEQMCRDVVVRLRERGHRVVVLTSRFRRADAAESPDDGDTRRELDVYWDGDLVFPTVARSLGIERLNKQHLKAALADVRPDVVAVWGMGALSLGLLELLARRRARLLYLIGDDWLCFGTWADAWMRRFSERPRLAGAVRVVTRLPTAPPADLGATGAFCFVSDYLRRRAEERTPWRFPLATVVHGGFDTRDFPVVAAPAVRPWHWRLMCVGRLHENKDAATAVRALAELPDSATLDLVGYGTDAERARLEQLAAELGISARIRFATAHRAELRERYLAADALLFPAAGTEGFGLVPLESMACATPVVATATGGSAEFLFDGVNCLRFAAGDAVGLAEALWRLARDERLRATLASAGVQTAAALTVDRLTDTLEAWLLAAAQGFAGGRPADREPIRPPRA